MTNSEIQRAVRKRCKRQGDCLVWTGDCDPHGNPRGRPQVGGKRQYLRPLMLSMLADKAPPADMVNPVAAVNCGNPACLLDAHLHWRSRSDVVADGARKTAHNQVRNANVAKAARARGKLTMDKVRRMRELYHAGGITTWDLGPMFGVSQKAAADVVMGRSWKEYGGVAATLLALGARE